MSFGTLLRQYRVARGLSQEALAERARLSAQAIRALESGRRQAPYRETVALLARALDLAAEDRAALEAAVNRRRVPLPSGPARPLQAPPTHRPRHNLPAPTSVLIGRAHDLSAAVTLLQGNSEAPVRLLTLTGAGGVGKTRLAIEIARDLLDSPDAYPDGAWLVDLAPLAEPALVVQTVAATLGLRETPGIPLLDSLCAHLADKDLLLVLDNCEHLITACAELAGALLRTCPHLRLLTTSREGLAIPEETIYRVPPLAFPDPRCLPSVEELGDYAAVIMLLERAQARGAAVTLDAHTAPAVAQICARLEGMPLAIELAAARLSALSVQQVAARLDDCFRLLTGGGRMAVARQQTLRATLDWSHALLSPPEQVLFRRLAVFAGGWTLEAAEAICGDAPSCHVPCGPGPLGALRAREGDALVAGPTASERPPPPLPQGARGLAEDAVLDVLAALVDKSLIQREDARPGDGMPLQGETRYRLLETVRQYGQEKLAAAGEAEAVRNRHLAWYLALAEEGALGLRGPEQLAWVHRLDVELDNFRAALTWSTLVGAMRSEAPSDHADKAAGLRLAGALFWFWDIRGYLREGLRWLETALAVGDTADCRLRAWALIGVGRALEVQGDLQRAWAVLEESLALYRALGDKAGMAQALFYLGRTAHARHDFPEAQKLYEQSLALGRDQHDGWTRAGAARQLAVLARIQAQMSHRDYRRAIALGEESVGLARAVGQPSLVAYALREMGEILYDSGDAERAGPVLAESLGLARAVGDLGAICGALKCMAQLTRVQGNAVRERAYAEELEVLARARGSLHDLREALWELSSLAIESGDVARAVALATEGMALERRELPTPQRGYVANCLMVLAIAAVALGQPVRAVQLFSANAAIEESIGGPPVVRAPSAEVCEEALTRARLALSEDAFAAAWERGAALSLDEAIAYALAPAGSTDLPANSVAARADLTSE